MLEQSAGLPGLKYGARGGQPAWGAHLGTVEAAPLAMAESSAGGGAVPLARPRGGEVPYRGACPPYARPHGSASRCVGDQVCGPMHQVSPCVMLT